MKYDPIISSKMYIQECSLSNSAFVNFFMVFQYTMEEPSGKDRNRYGMWIEF